MRARRGFTLVEAVVATAIAALVLGAAFAIWRSGMTGTESSLHILTATGELHRLSRAVAADCARTRVVLWENGAIRIPAGETDLVGRLGAAPSGMHEIILELDGARVIWRFQPGPDGGGTIERAEELVVAGLPVESSIQQFGTGMTQEFRLVPIEREQMAPSGGPPMVTRSLALRVAMAGGARQRAPRALVVESILCPASLAPTTWNGFE